MSSSNRAPAGPAASALPTDEACRRAVLDVYAAAAVTPDSSLCCVAGTQWTLPGLSVPPAMHAMNYGCGSTVHPGDLAGARPILYVGVGGGLEALQFAYFRRQPGGVIAVDPVPEMRAAAAANLALAAASNPWFRPEFVTLLDGSAEALPVPGGSVDVVAQNCLFNVFVDGDLRAALSEVHRVLAPGGRFSTSDPIATAPIPEALRRNTTLRARCCSGCRTYDEYLAALHEAGFSRIAVRARRPYRLLLPQEFPELDAPLLLESIDLLAVRGAGDGREPLAVFTGRTAINAGSEPMELAHGLLLLPGQPVPVSDATAGELARRPDVVLTPPTFHAEPGCC
jgi:SAM-dependent methyltransferase